MVDEAEYIENALEEGAGEGEGAVRWKGVITIERWSAAVGELLGKAAGVGARVRVRARARARARAK